MIPTCILLSAALAAEPAPPAAGPAPAPATAAAAAPPAIGACALCGQELRLTAEQLRGLAETRPNLLICPDCRQPAPTGIAILSDALDPTGSIRVRTMRFPNGNAARLAQAATPASALAGGGGAEAGRDLSRRLRSDVGLFLGVGAAFDEEPTLGFNLGVDWAPFGRPREAIWHEASPLQRCSVNAGVLFGEWTGRGFDAPGWFAGAGFEIARGAILRVGAAWIDRDGQRAVPFVGITF